ncbi:MAG TPA: hypothetical protein ENG99_00570 [bacterium]|nr:hypothetical protein [bacterium]
MRLFFTKSFERDYKKLPTKIQKQLDKQLTFLLTNSKYPSLRIKKMEGYFDILEGRISKNYRFTFQIKKEAYYIHRAGTHKILNNP